MQTLTPDVLCGLINNFVTADEPKPEPESAPKMSIVEQMLCAFAGLNADERQQFLVRLNAELTRQR